MRSLYAFILRLLVDSEAPNALRGSLSAVPRGPSYSFADARGLIRLLDEMMRTEPEPAADDRQRGVADDKA